MAREKIRVLLIEDDSDDILFIKEEFSKIQNTTFFLHSVGTLRAGLAYLAEQAVDVLLLDLNLPDSIGLNTLVDVKKVFPDLAIIVLTSADDETSAIELVHQGAQDYLVKGLEAQHLLVRSIRYAIERQGLLLELDETRQRERDLRETNLFEQYSQASNTSITAEIYGQLALRYSAPALFNEIAQRYADLLDQALEQHAFHVENRVSPSLRMIAEKLSLCRASARDVIDVHTAAIKLKNLSAVPLKRQAYLDASRLMVVELMGNLLMCYRNYYSGSFFIDKKKE
jgi:DNA-binding response OmpR family regulator